MQRGDPQIVSVGIKTLAWKREFYVLFGGSILTYFGDDTYRGSDFILR